MRRKRKAKAQRDRFTDADEPRVALAGAAKAVAIVSPIVVLLLGLAAFYPALGAEFVNLDDDRLFVTNKSYRGLDAEHLRWMFTTTFMGHYQPLTWMSSAVDYTISGLNPSSYHRNNVILHCVNGLLLYFVAIRLLAAALKLKPGESWVLLRLASVVAALLFAVHPLRAESVAWASERRDVLSTFFLLLTLLAYLRADGSQAVSLRSRGWYVGSIVLLAASLLSKAWGMSFVVLVTILDIYPLHRLPSDMTRWWQREYRPIWIQKIPYLLLGVAAAMKAGQAQRSALDTMKTLEEWGIVERIVQAFYGLGFYAIKTVWPSQLAVVYELPYDLDPFTTRYVLPIVVVTAVGAAVILSRRRHPALLAISACYVVTLVPVLGFVQSGPQFVADRYSYVSCIGWALLGGGLLLTLWRRSQSTTGRLTSGITVCTVVIVLFVLTWRQTAVWHDSKALWQQAIATNPSSIAHQNYGILLRAEGRIDEAIEHYARAVAIKPDAGNAWFALGNAKKAKTHYIEAEKAYLQAVRFMTQRHSGYLNLGNLYYNNLRRVDDAVAAYQAGIDYMEAHRSKLFKPQPYLALGIALKQKGDWDGARRALRVAAKYRATRDQAAKHLRSLTVNGP